MSEWFLLAQAASATQVTQDPTIVAAAIAAAIVLVLSSLGGTVVLIINASSASKDRRESATERRIQLELTKDTNKQATETNEKAGTLVVETAKIHTLTNDTNSQLQKALALKDLELFGANQTIAKMVEEKRETAAMRVVTDLQTSVALQTPVAVIPIAPLGGRGTRSGDTPLAPAAEKTLKNIEANTAATADAVKDLKDP